MIKRFAFIFHFGAELFSRRHFSHSSIISFPCEAFVLAHTHTLGYRGTSLVRLNSGVLDEEEAGGGDKVYGADERMRVCARAFGVSSSIVGLVC